MRNKRIIRNSDKHEIIAIGTYHGKIVKAKAKCNPDDEYDEDFGEKLALARLELKILNKRIKTANQRLSDLDYLIKFCEAMRNKYSEKIEQTSDNLQELISQKNICEQTIIDMYKLSDM